MSKKVTFIASGDSFITRQLPDNGYDGLSELVKLISSHDVRFNNLEITLHRKEGYPAAFSGGTWAMADPRILRALQKFGFNLFNTANNHSCDYSHGGLLATMKYLRESGAPFAGTGANLAEAAAPAYLETANARVALLASCSSFHESAAAGNQSPDMIGRPGLNPLGFRKVFHVQKDQFDLLRVIADATCMNAEKEESIRLGYSQPLPEDCLNFGGLSFQCDAETKTTTEPLVKDLDRMLATIREAKRQADYALVSIHAHEYAGKDTTEPADFLKTYSRACIDAGADAILGHGPHELRGIEIYKGKPIFYSLGNFIFQTETVGLQPADAYENAKMPAGTSVGEYMDKRSSNETCGYVVMPQIWQAVMAGFTAEDGELTQITLYPITLNMDEPRSLRGWPCLMKDRAVLERLQTLSAPFGTKLEIEDGKAVIRLK